ncbi:MAG TPA: head GIN domain-containing protein [Flavobacterium sp.]|nr:head GIN domain-containing protein [Flavobacterium sp.]
MKKSILAVFLMLCQVNFGQDKITKDLGDFSKVKVFDRISLHLVPGNENKLEISGDRKNNVEVVNNNGELKVRMKLGKLLKGDDINATLYFTDKIESLEASEGSYLSSEAAFKAIDFDVDAKEGAEIKISLNVQKLNARASSGGILRLSGTASSQDGVINSGAALKAKDLNTKLTAITVNAGGEAEVRASDLVDAKTRAGGSIHIYGNPKQVNKKNVIGGTINIHK